ncbi:acyl-CoA dehydrogenase family protein [Peribacillus frigoritolerans]|nr:acyl-CoA dehydrogenase family protein [Peribacillus frigoritolerans]
MKWQEKPSLPEGTLKDLQEKAKKSRVFGASIPRRNLGGADLGQLMMAIVLMEVSKTFVPFSFGGLADNILYYANEEQKQKYLIPTINGEKKVLFCHDGTGSWVQYEKY